MLFLRCWSVDKNVAQLSKTNCMTFTKKNKETRAYSSNVDDVSSIIILDNKSNVLKEELLRQISMNVLSADNDYVERSESKHYYIILANLDKHPVPDIQKILQSFPKDEKSSLNFFNHNLKVDVYDLVNELANTMIYSSGQYGLIAKKFNIYVRYNAFYYCPPRSLGPFTPDVSKMCGQNPSGFSIPLTSYLLLLFCSLSTL